MSMEQFADRSGFEDNECTSGECDETDPHQRALASLRAVVPVIMHRTGRRYARMRSTLGLLVIALLLASGPAAAATPIHVCGKVTAYFISDLASGGRIELDGKNHPIASSASFPRTRPLPAVQVGTSVCVDGTVDDSGRLLDFTVTAAASPNAATPSSLPSTASADGQIDLCGTLQALSPARDGQPAASSS